MPESQCHVDLVALLVKWIATEHLDGNVGGVLWDSGGTTRSEVPPLVGGYRPDAYATASLDNRCIVGEAKSPWDLENRHTTKQLLAFLTYCQQIKNAVLVLAVPWHCAPLASNMIENLKRQHGLGSIEAIVLKDLPG